MLSLQFVWFHIGLFNMPNIWLQCLFLFCYIKVLAFVALMNFKRWIVLGSWNQSELLCHYFFTNIFYLFIYILCISFDSMFELYCLEKLSIHMFVSCPVGNLYPYLCFLAAPVPKKIGDDKWSCNLVRKLHVCHWLAVCLQALGEISLLLTCVTYFWLGLGLSCWLRRKQVTWCWNVNVVSFEPLEQILMWLTAWTGLMH